ncbi:MAG: hypothetical protein HY005_02360 [Candidatus Staskawiczbacteria bacterium]|nr:hypothetical protein [Candidatus Staskawiczbacteria bacterium]MBI3337446.1 hypothetical protein [Candidatus Staskawiczbacteria bacterium]
MKNQKGISLLIGITIIVIVTIVIVGGVFAYQYFVTQKVNNTQIKTNNQNNKPSIIITSPNGGSYINGQNIVVSYNASGLNPSRQYIAQIMMEIPGGYCGPGPNFEAGSCFFIAQPCYTDSCSNTPVINGSNRITLSIPYTLHKDSGSYQINFKVIDWTSYLAGVGESPTSVASTTSSGLISVSRSPTFVSPTITIISPRLGEQWVQGSTHDIKWTSTNLPTNEQVAIMALDYSDNTSTRQNIVIASGVLASQGTYSWTVPTNVLGNKFNIQIGSVNAYGLLVSGPASPSATGFLSIVR